MAVLSIVYGWYELSNQHASTSKKRTLNRLAISQFAATSKIFLKLSLHSRRKGFFRKRPRHSWKKSCARAREYFAHSVHFKIPAFCLATVTVLNKGKRPEEKNSCELRVPSALTRLYSGGSTSFCQNLLTLLYDVTSSFFLRFSWPWMSRSKWFRAHSEMMKTWGLKQEKSMRSVIFKADPVRVDFQTVAVLQPSYRFHLEKTNGYKTSPLELTESESNLHFLLFDSN